MRKPWTAKEARLLIEMRRAGCTYPQIAAAVNHTVVQARVYGRYVGLAKRRKRPAELRRAILSRVERGLSDRDAALEIGLSQSAVQKARRRAGIPRADTKNSVARKVSVARKASVQSDRMNAFAAGWPAVSPPQFRVLEAIESRGPSTCAELTGTLGVRKSWVGKCLRRLSDAGHLLPEKLPRQDCFLWRLSPRVAERRRRWLAVCGLVPD